MRRHTQIALKTALGRDGYWVTHDVNPDALLDLACQLGSPQPDPRDHLLVKDIHPQPKERANPNTLSSRYGLGAFPFHTEAAYLSAPPRFLLLYCVHPGDGARPTLLLDASSEVLYFNCCTSKNSLARRRFDDN